MLGATTTPSLCFRGFGSVKITFSIVSLAPIRIHILKLLRLDLREVAGRHHYNEHQEHKNNHHVQAELTLHLDLVGCASAIGTTATYTLTGRLTLIEVLLGAIQADVITP